MRLLLSESACKVQAIGERRKRWNAKPAGRNYRCGKGPVRACRAIQNGDLGQRCSWP
jgi:hypothetical protein